MTFTQSFNYEWSSSNLPRSGKGTAKWSLGNGGGRWTVVKASNELAGRAAIEAEVNRKIIEGIVGQYRDAHNQRDIKKITQLYPKVRTDILQRRFRDCSKADLAYIEPRVRLLSETEARVETGAVYNCTPATRQAKQTSAEQKDTFVFEKVNGSWTIVDYQISLGGR